MKNSRDFVPSALFDDLLLHFRDGATTENMVGGMIQRGPLDQLTQLIGLLRRTQIG